ncbi:uncharacterized protein LOC142579130 [Dermacentor variabilis]|uniref:uncharacterized protein LOC142579130 n=1 Tax=Dermacentor variabilis TaxID=34621 RepID=UPI003F5B1EDB
MSYGSPCRCTCGALGNARSHSRPPPRQQRYSRIRISCAPGEQPTRVAASSPLGSRSLAEGVSVNDVDALIELLSSPPSHDSVTYGGSDHQQQHQLTQATSIGCSPSSSNVIGRSSGTPVLTPRSTSNELTTSEQLVVQLFMDEVDIKEREIAAAALAAVAKEQEEGNSDVEATTAEDDSPWPTYCNAEAGHRGARSIGCGALAAPSTLALLLLAAVLVSNALLAVAYYEKRTWLCVTTVGLMHSPSLLFFVARVYSVAVLASIKEHFMRALVLIWYSVTLPLLHVLPLLTLSSVLFDKVMMATGDRSDMRLFIGRQEDAAFSDLIWVAVLHAFPQAVLQLHLLLFAGGAARLLRGDFPDYTAVLQMVSVLSCALLIACVATFYSKYVVRGRGGDEETMDGSATYETATTTTTALQECDEDTGTGYLLKFAAWLLITVARIVAGSSLLAVYFGPAVLALALAHVPVVLLWSLVCRTRYSAAKFFGDLALGLITLVFVLDYRALNREGLASTMSAVVFLCATFFENTVCLALAYMMVGGGPPHYTVLLVLVGTHYAAMTCGVFLLLCHIRMRHRKAEYAF